MNNTDRLPSVCKWLSMSRDQTLDRFYSLKNAFSDGKGQERFVYVPGTREDRVLIVAHADTVWGTLAIKPDYHNDVVFSAKRLAKWCFINRWNNKIHRVGVGIGADDRAGCYIAWKLRELGHSILITSGEEIGCVATQRIMAEEWWAKEINNTHSFAVQFDRRGKNDIVFYNIGTNAFAKYVKENTGYKPQDGFSTDIKFLCTDICGVNMSVGYYGEHTPDERLSISQLENTLNTAKTWLSQPKMEKFPLTVSDRFYNLEEKKKTKKSSSSNTTIYDADFVYNTSKVDAIPPSMSIKKVERPLTDDKNATCQKCGKSSSIDAWFLFGLKCPHCNDPII